jgi:hypothetical protein
MWGLPRPLTAIIGPFTVKTIQRWSGNAQSSQPPRP